VSWAAAAAAIMVVALVALWPGGGGGGLAWADVVERLSELRTLSARVVTEESRPSRSTVIRHARLYQQDPGLSRSEMILPAGPGADGETVLSVRIARSGPDRSTLIDLDPRWKTAHRTILTFGGRLVESRAAMPTNLVAESWTRMKEITSDQTRRIGDRVADGVAVTGFEADIRHLFRDPQAALVEGTIRIWAASDSGVPVEVGLEFTDEAQAIHRTRFSELEWNLPLDSGLFDLPDLEGWTVTEERVHRVSFSRTRLRDGVTLRIGPADGPAVLTEDQVRAVSSGQSVGTPGADDTRRTVALLISPSGAARLADYTRAHLGESVVLDFNGEVRTEIRIGGVIRNRLQLDITPLGVTLEQFERDYLAD
jgi:outer membrane lipoprotein-sorting protein